MLVEEVQGKTTTDYLTVAFIDSHGEAEKPRALQSECGPFVSRTRAGVIPPAGVLSRPNERSFQTCESAWGDKEVKHLRTVIWREIKCL